MSHCDAPGYPYTLDTIGKLIDDGYKLAVYCDPCGLSQGWADLEGLAARLGRDFTTEREALIRELPCPDCLRPMDIRLHPPAPDSGGAHFHG